MRQVRDPEESRAFKARVLEERAKLRTMRDIAKEFGVSHQYIHQICTRAYKDSLPPLPDKVDMRKYRWSGTPNTEEETTS